MDIVNRWSILSILLIFSNINQFVFDVGCGLTNRWWLPPFFSLLQNLSFYFVPSYFYLLRSRKILLNNWLLILKGFSLLHDWYELVVVIWRLDFECWSPSLVLVLHFNYFAWYVFLICTRLALIFVHFKFLFNLIFFLRLGCWKYLLFLNDLGIRGILYYFLFLLLDFFVFIEIL